MDADLTTLTRELALRLEGRALPGATPQLLACHGGRAVLRTRQGLQQIDEAALPAQVDLAPLIDHTLLKAAATAEDIDKLCAEAREHQFASVCVNGAWVARAAAALAGSPVRVCTVVGFPLGASTPETKAFEAKEAVQHGAGEVDMVLSVGLAKAGDWEAVRRDYRAVREATRGVCLKVILETCLLTDAEKRRACELAAEESLDFVKTSTGFSTGGATAEDVRLMREAVGGALGVKASGGVRTYAEALAMVRAGATRLGVSASIAIVQGGGAAAAGGY